MRSALLLLVLGLTGCPSSKAPDPTPPPAPEATMSTPAPPLQDPPATGLQLTLAEGGPPPLAAEPERRVAGEPLSAERTATLLERVPPLRPEDADRQAFAFPAATLPPPRTGETVQAKFPPAEDGGPPPTPAPGPVTVVRYQPEGDVPLAPHLSVTFDQPMIAVTGQDDAARQVPVTLRPLPPGQWRWVGTRTLLFEPEGRFPMATEYTATVPAGTKSAAGTALAEAVSWTFRTPPPTLTARHPQGGGQPLAPAIFAGFDQQMAPSAALQVTAGGEPIETVRLSPEAVAADATLKALAERAGEGRWLAVRPKAPLAPDTAVQVTVPAGTASAEGPLTTREPQSFELRTFGAFTVEDQSCKAGRRCTPLSRWWVRLTNAIDPKTLDPAAFELAPAVEGVRYEANGRMLQVIGPFPGRQTYSLKLPDTLRDVHGQPLTGERTLQFVVGEAQPTLQRPGGPLVILDPAGGPRLPVYVMNHERVRVRLMKVTPDDWGAFQEWVRRPDEREPPGKIAFDQPVGTSAQPDRLTEMRVDLSPALQDGRGHVIALIEPEDAPTEPWRRQRVLAWVQATALAVDAVVDDRELVAWATDLATGAPAAGATVRLAPGGAAAETDAAGLARLPLPDAGAREARIEVQRGADVAFLPENLYAWGGGTWIRRTRQDSLRWYVFDDRQMYRPGETARVKGWARRIGAGPTGDVGALPADVKALKWLLRDARNNTIGEGEARIDAFGGFDLTLAIPEGANLGHARLELTAPATKGLTGLGHVHTLQVQAFRRPEFEVSATASEGPHLVGGHATATVTASYYSGGPLPGADVTWRVVSRPGHFTPPNRGDYVFGQWTPWWLPRPTGAAETRTFAGRTDGDGRHHLRLDFEGVEPPRPSSVEAEASVQDVNRQTWTARAHLLVHPARHYVGLRVERTVVEPGKPFEVRALVTDLEGAAVAGSKIVLQSARLEWRQEGTDWREVPVDPQDCTVESGTEAVTCTFTPKAGGRHRVRATITDPDGRRNTSELFVWVPGGKQPERRDLTRDEVQLVPDRETYQPGDTARVLVQAPFEGAEGLLVVARSGLLETRRFTIEGTSHTLEIPIVEAHIPNLYVQVELVGSAPRDGAAKAARRPAYAGGSLNLNVPALARTLAVQATPREKTLAPGGETTVDLEVKDAAGQPVEGAQVALVVVDEAVLALSGYTLRDPVAVLYAAREAGTRQHHGRDFVQLAAADEVEAELEEAKEEGAMGGAMPPPAPAAMMMRKAAPGGGDAAPEPIALRTNFDALAVFAPDVRTAADGRATVPVKLPDSLTRYRVMAVAVEPGNRFGHAESSIIARLPVTVRPSAPRFLNFGDRVELPFVVHNQTEAPLDVELAVRTSNLQLLDAPGRKVRVPASDRVEVRFPATTVSAGTARFQAAAVSAAFADAAQGELPVWTPATTEAFATYGELDAGALRQPIDAPDDALPAFGGLEVTTSSTALQALTDAVLYLVQYPYECAEQRASRVLAVAALKDVLAAFEAEGLPPPDEIRARVDADLEVLGRQQNADGGFGFWRRDQPSYPYVSLHVAHALARAQGKGFTVPPGTAQRALAYARDIRRHLPGDYPEAVKRVLRAYAIYVRAHLGDPAPADARALIDEAGLDGLSLEAIGWLLPTLSQDEKSAGTESGQYVADIRRLLNNRVTETAAGAQFATHYEDGAHLLLHSSRRADGILLEALIADQPQSDLVPKLVRALLGHRTRGRWGNTQENVFILLALDRYFATYEAKTPDFVARAWLGDRFAGEHRFRGRTTERHALDIPMEVLGQAEVPLVLAKEGPGRLYYRIGLRYAPRDLTLEPADRGFTVERRYEAVGDAAAVTRDDDGTWRIRAGSEVRVHLTMVAPSRRTHVALVDPLPAGLEAINPALAVSARVDVEPEGSRGRWWWWGPWFEHQNLRDERAEAFSALVPAGVHTYSYVARATTPGAFVVPPPRAEEMYHPETFGRGGTDKVVVE